MNDCPQCFSPIDGGRCTNAFCGYQGVSGAAVERVNARRAAARARALGAVASAPKSDDLRTWFEKYDLENPMVYEAFKTLAREKRAEGHERYGAKTIMEILRWESAVRYKEGGFKLANNIKDRCSARYARKLIKEDPTFEKFFETRELTTPDQRDKLSDAHG